MANQEHYDRLIRGVAGWNSWRKEQAAELRPDLSGASLRGANLSGVDLSNANLGEADLNGADLSESNLNGANLSKADLSFVNLNGATLSGAYLIGTHLIEATSSGADFSRADLMIADLIRANLSGANFSDANLSGAILIETNLSNARLVNCSIYGVSVWGANLKDTIQENLRITPEDEPPIVVDNLKVAQFLYLLLNNEEIRDVIETITSKGVLILGRFTPEQKPVLDALRDAIRQHNLLPIMYDFQEAEGKNRTETIRLLAHLARFIIADITNAKAVPVELQSIVPDLPSVPVQLIMQEGWSEYAMLDHILMFRSVLPEVYRYRDVNDLLTALPDKVIAPANQKAQELAARLDQIRKQLL